MARAVDELLLQFLFQTLQGQRDGRLRAQQPLRGPRKALLRGDSEENLKRIEFHAVPIITIPYVNFYNYKFAKSNTRSA